LRNRKSIILLLLLLFSAGALSAQNNLSFLTVRDTFKVTPANKFYLSSITVLPGSEVVYLKHKILSKESYRINREDGYISLNLDLNKSILDTLIITYRSFFSGLKKEYAKRNILDYTISSSDQSAKVLSREKSQSLSESVFGRGIQKSGSIIRGFNVSSNRDFTLNSGLRLQLSGRLSDDIEIVAALSDENVPLQPEGNTERLNELDKVFIQIKHKNLIGTFGDYELKNNYGEFSRISRKLQGLKGEFSYGDISGFLSIASAWGRFANNSLFGRDGNQGPYRLYGSNNENDITIIAGTEKVYVDGIEMKRGENNDYTIDYSAAQITFTSRRVITSASRINSDFEYTDRKYQRNFLGLNLAAKLFEEKVKISFNYLRESDDRDNMVDYTLTDDEKKTLANAGGDPSKAIVTGVSVAPLDSTGKSTGIYIKADTTISGTHYVYYKYAAGNPSAIYNVVFTYVGEGKGDYTRETLSYYKFAGAGKGSYLPLKYLPLPELKQNANLIIETTPIKELAVNLELAGSIYNPNRFSSVNNTGFAANLFADMKPLNINLFNTDIGKISLTLHERYLQNNYSPFDRINPIEFNRDYNITSSTQSSEELREINLTYLPIQKLVFNAKYGMLSRGDSFSSDRIVSSLKYNDADFTQDEYNVDYVKTRNLNFTSSWNKQNGRAYYTFGSFRPGIEFLFDERKEYMEGNDSLMSSSFRYIETAPYLELAKISGFDMRTQVSFRQEYFPLNGQFNKQSDAFLRSLKVGFKSSNVFSTTLNLTLRNKYITEVFKSKGYSDNETFLIYSQSRFNLFNGAVTGDAYYEAATEQTARQQKVFVKVLKGTGNYKYLGDVNKNGVADEADFELTAYDGEFIVVYLPTDQLFPTVDLKTSSRWNIEFAKFFQSPGFFQKILSPISTETFIRIEENSKDTQTKDIYFLNLNKFLNDSTTIRGSKFFQQDLFLFKNESDFSIRFRFSERKNLAQYAAGAERGFFNEKGIRAIFKLVEEISNQTELTATNDNYFAASSNNRKRQVTKSEINSDFSYRPENNIEAGLKLSAASIEDRFPAVPTKISLNSQLVRMNFSFVGIGRLRLEIERDEYVSNSANFIPYEVTNGNRLGKNYYWRVNFDYRLAANFSASINYDGRILSDSPAIHSLRAEARAFF